MKAKDRHIQCLELLGNIATIKFEIEVKVASFKAQPSHEQVKWAKKFDADMKLLEDKKQSKLDKYRALALLINSTSDYPFANYNYGTTK